MTVTGHLSQLKYKNVSEICLCVKSIFIFDADQERKILFLSAELWGFCKGQILPHLFFIFSNGLDRYKLLKIFYRVILMLIASFAKNFLDRHAAESFPLWVGVAGPRVLQKHLLAQAFTELSWEQTQLQAQQMLIKTFLLCTAWNYSLFPTQPTEVLCREAERCAPACGHLAESSCACPRPRPRSWGSGHPAAACAFRCKTCVENWFVGTWWHLRLPAREVVLSAAGRPELAPAAVGSGDFALKLSLLLLISCSYVNTRLWLTSQGNPKEGLCVEDRLFSFLARVAPACTQPRVLSWRPVRIPEPLKPPAGKTGSFAVAPYRAGPSPL